MEMDYDTAILHHRALQYYSTTAWGGESTAAREMRFSMPPNKKK
jgi:hypothetical protein